MQSQDRAKKISKLPNQREYHFKLPKTKFELISAVLSRWWYHFDNFYCETKQHDFEHILKENQFREVPEHLWDKEPELLNGLLKVKPLKKFKGWFVDAQNNCHDLRDPSKVISFGTLKKLEIKELVQILYKCIKKQIRALQDNQEYYEVNLEYALRKFLKKIKQNFSQFLDQEEKQ